MGRNAVEMITGAALIAASFIPGVNAITIPVLATHLSTVLFAAGATLAARGLAASRESNNTVTATYAGEVAPIPVVYGEAQVGGRLVECRKDPDKDEDQHVVVAWCVGSENGSGVDGIAATFLDGTLDSDGQKFFDKSSPLVEKAHHLGTAAQTVDAVLTAKFPTEWPSTSAGRGVCYTRYLLHTKAGKLDTAPQGYLATIRGRWVYDTRDSTWKYSKNPALCVRDFLLSKLCGWGEVITASLLDEQSFIDAANYCDEQVACPGGTQTRYLCNVALAGSLQENLNTLLSTCRGRIIFQGGKLRLSIRAPKAPVSFKLTPDVIVSGTTTITRRGAANCPNKIRYTWTDPYQKGQASDGVWPRPGDANGMLTADGGFVNEKNVNLVGITDKIMAEQIAMITCREPRADAAVELTAKEAALVLQVDDVVQLTHSTPGWVDKAFWVDAVVPLAMDGTVHLVLSEYDANAFSLDAQNTFDSPPGSDLANPFEVQPPEDFSAVPDPMITPDGASIPMIACTWTRSPHAWLDHYELVWKEADNSSNRNDLTDCVAAPPPPADVTKAEIGPVEANKTYLVQIRAVNTLGIASDWVWTTVDMSGEALTAGARLDWLRILSSDKTKESIRLIGTSETNKTVIFYKTWLQSTDSLKNEAEPADYTRYPAGSLYDDDPVILDLTFDKVTGEDVRYICGYAASDDGAESHPPLFLALDANSEPTGALDADIDQETGELIILPQALDSDAGSCRFYACLGNFELPAFTARAGEYSISAANFGEPIHTGIIVPQGKSGYAKGWFFDTSSTDPDDQQAALRSEECSAMATRPFVTVGNNSTADSAQTAAKFDAAVNTDIDTSGFVQLTIRSATAQYMRVQSYRYATSTTEHVTVLPQGASGSNVNWSDPNTALTGIVFDHGDVAGPLQIGQTCYTSVWLFKGPNATGDWVGPIKCQDTRGAAGQPLMIEAYCSVVPGDVRAMDRVDVTLKIAGGISRGLPWGYNATVEAWINKDTWGSANFGGPATDTFTYTNKQGLSLTKADWPALGGILMPGRGYEKILQFKVTIPVSYEDANTQVMVPNYNEVIVIPPPGDGGGITIQSGLNVGNPDTGTTLINTADQTVQNSDVDPTSTVAGEDAAVVAKGQQGVFLEYFKQPIITEV